MGGKHRRPIRTVIGEATIVVALLLLAASCVGVIVLAMSGGWRQ